MNLIRSFEVKNKIKMDNKILMNIAISAANEAGKAILAIYSKDFAVEYKKDNSPLTDADCAANEIIRDKLSKTSYPIISEENKQISYSQRKIGINIGLLILLMEPKNLLKEMVSLP